MLDFHSRVKKRLEKLSNCYVLLPYCVETPISYALFHDHHEKYQHAIFQYVVMALNWLKLYETCPVIAGQWGYCDKHIAPNVKEYIKLIQGLFDQTISFAKVSQIRGVNCYCWHCLFCHQQVLQGSKLTLVWLKNNCAGLTYKFNVALWYQHIVSVYGPKPAAAPDITMVCGGNVDVCAHKQYQLALYFKIPDEKCAVGDSAYCREPSTIVCLEEGHDDELKEFMLPAKNRQEYLHSQCHGLHVLSLCFRHGTSSANEMEYHQTCVKQTRVSSFSISWVTCFEPLF